MEEAGESTDATAAATTTATTAASIASVAAADTATVATEQGWSAKALAAAGKGLRLSKGISRDLQQLQDHNMPGPGDDAPNTFMHSRAEAHWAPMNLLPPPPTASVPEQGWSAKARAHRAAVVAARKQPQSSVGGSMMGPKAATLIPALDPSGGAAAAGAAIATAAAGAEDEAAVAVGDGSPVGSAMGLAAGMAVYARFQATMHGKIRTKTYPGHIELIHPDGFVKVRYSDGDVEEKVDPCWVQKQSGKRGSILLCGDSAKHPRAQLPSPIRGSSTVIHEFSDAAAATATGLAAELQPAPPAVTCGDGAHVTMTHGVTFNNPPALALSLPNSSLWPSHGLTVHSNPNHIGGGCHGGGW